MSKGVKEYVIKTALFLVMEKLIPAAFCTDILKGIRTILQINSPGFVIAVFTMAFVKSQR